MLRKSVTVNLKQKIPLPLQNMNKMCETETVVPKDVIVISWNISTDILLESSFISRPVRGKYSVLNVQQ